MLGALLLAMIWLVANVQSNLERQNINSGFGFLSERAGFGINQTLIDYTEDSSFGRVLAVGLLNTLLVSVLGVFFATLLGFALGVARLSRNWLINKTAMVYVERCRACTSSFFEHSLLSSMVSGLVFNMAAHGSEAQMVAAAAFCSC